MYAQITHPTDAAAGLDEARGRDGFAGGYALRHMGNARHTLVLLWRDGTAADPGHGPLHEVEDDWAGPGAGTAPAAATVLSFDGPLSDEIHAAAGYAGRHRLAPAVRDLPGIVRGLACWDGERRALRVVNLAASPDDLETMARAINATELLPGEDPALLPGPDRIDIYRVIGS